ncbi:MAG: GNAT family N-acetyltransferase [Candidatus Omnitrophota bacterium]
MECRWIEDIAEFKAISTKWDEALISSGNHNPFLLSDFIISWWRHFNERALLRIFVVYDRDKIIAGLPLYLKKSGARDCFARFLRYVGGTAANYTEPLCVSADIGFFPLLTGALEKKRDWDVLYLSDVRPESRLAQEFEEFIPLEKIHAVRNKSPNEIREQSSLTGFISDRRFVCRAVNDHFNWAIDLSGGEEIYLSSVSPKLKRDLRAKRKRLLDDCGKIELKELRGSGDIEKYFNLYAKFSRNAFSARGKNSNFENKKYTEFFREFLTLMDKNGRLDAHALLAGENVLAVSFGYKFGKGFNWALTGYNNDYKYYRPGYLLIEELIKEVSRRQETYYNWYGYERFYKSQWCNSQTPLRRFFLIRKNLRGFCYRALQALEKTLKSSKLITAVVRKIRGLKPNEG